MDLSSEAKVTEAAPLETPAAKVDSDQSDAIAG